MKNCVTILATTFALTLPFAVHAQTITPPAVPASIRVDPPNQAFLIGHATGTQNYECQPVKSLGQVGWVLFTPQATLFDDLGEQLTTHFFSPNPVEGGIVRPTWQDSKDTSTVWAQATGSSLDANFVKPNSIAWLRLDVELTGTQAGPTGGDGLLRTTFIQRVNTDGGAAPSTGCSVPTDIGRKEFVPYTADYVFYRK
jgi:hypothetical protein